MSLRELCFYCDIVIHAIRLSHLARGVCPDSLRSAAILHDQLTRKCFKALIGDVAITSKQQEQAILPVRFGGFGMTSLQTVFRFAFVPSWGYSLEKLPKRFSSLEEHVNVVLSSCKEEGSIGYQLEQLLGNDKQMSEILSNTKKLQHRLADAKDRHLVSTLIDSLSRKDAARLTSQQGKGAGAWLSAIPSYKTFALTSSNLLWLLR